MIDIRFFFVHSLSTCCFDIQQYHVDVTVSNPDELTDELIAITIKKAHFSLFRLNSPSFNSLTGCGNPEHGEVNSASVQFLLWA
jgi:hypothetical protein